MAGGVWGGMCPSQDDKGETMIEKCSHCKKSCKRELHSSADIVAVAGCPDFKMPAAEARRKKGTTRMLTPWVRHKIKDTSVEMRKILGGSNC